MPSPAANVVAGCNYIVCNSVATHNFSHLLTSPGTFSATIMQAELDEMNTRGAKVFRVFPSYWNYAIDKADYEANLKAISAKLVANGQQVLVVLFEGVGATSATLPGFGGPTGHPWYNFIGKQGSRVWDPSVAANPGLFNGVNGLLDQWVTLDLAAFTFQKPYTDLTGGGWLDCPGSTYFAAYPHYYTTYPNLPSHADYGDGATITRHQVWWEALKQWITDTLTWLEDAGATVWGIDVANELSLATGAASIIRADAIMSGEFGLRLPSSSAWSAVEVIRRRFGFMKWFMAYLRDKHPTREVTSGCVTLADAALDNFNHEFDWLSYHDYGNGFLTSGSIQAARDYGDSIGKHVCLSEFGVLQEGTKHITRAWYECQQRGVGAIMWEWFESQAFGQSVAGIENWAPSADPRATFLAYPRTGFARSVGAIPTFQQRRSDLFADALTFFSGAPLAKPTEWRIVELAGWSGGARQFKIQDEDGADLVPGVGTEVNWRRLATGTLSGKPLGLVRGTDRHEIKQYPGIGEAIDTSTQTTKTGVGSEVFDLTLAEIVAAPDGEILIGAWFGDMTYDATAYETMQLEPVVSILLSKHYLLTGAIVTSETRQQVIGNADTPGIPLDQTDPAFEGRRQSWLTVPVHEPGYFVDDTSVGPRSVPHIYYLPMPDGVAGLDPNGWGNPSVSSLRHQRPPCGFQNLCYRVTSTGVPNSDGCLAFEVVGVDCLLREIKETVRIDVATDTVNDDRVWGEVAWRELHYVKLIENSLDDGTSPVLQIGWTFDVDPVNPEDPYEHDLVPTVDVSGASVLRGWRVGFPVELHRSADSGSMKTHEIDGYTFCNGDVTRTDSVQARTLEIDQAGGWGKDGEEANRMPKFETGVFDLGSNTWQPAQHARPVLIAGEGGENPVQVRWYNFLLNVQRNMMGGPLQP